MRNFVRYAPALCCLLWLASLAWFWMDPSQRTLFVFCAVEAVALVSVERAWKASRRSKRAEE